MTVSQLEGHSRLFCDTSFFFASLVNSDSHHEQAVKHSRTIRESGIQCVTTWDIISETLTLLIRRHTYNLAIWFMEEIEPPLTKIDCTDEVRQQAKKTFKKFNRDGLFSFCDCLSYHVIRDLLSGIPALSYDEDFKKMGLIVMA